MSTKATITHDDNFHFYEECFDENNVYLQLDNATNFTVESTNYGNYVTVSVSTEILNKICEAWIKKNESR